MSEFRTKTPKQMVRLLNQHFDIVCQGFCAPYKVVREDEKAVYVMNNLNFTLRLEQITQGTIQYIGNNVEGNIQFRD